jgi:hypothetical protein
MEVVGWLQEESAEVTVPQTPGDITRKEAEPASGDGFSRYWIHSHHIYSKAKRRDLLALAQQYRLTGFCLPGKPGIICVEVGDSRTT